MTGNLKLLNAFTWCLFSLSNNNEACNFGCKVLTLPSRISLNLVKLVTDLHLYPNLMICSAVEPVEIILMLNFKKVSQIFFMPLLLYTDNKAYLLES